MRLKLAKLLTLLLCGFITFASIPATYAASICDIPCRGDDAAACEDIKKANGCGGGESSNTLQSTIVNILKVVIGISGLVAVVFVVIGGIQYTTSLGDVGKIKKAKDTILYALIGIAVCALAFAVVNWVIGTALTGGSSESEEEEGSPTSLILEIKS